MSRRVKMLVITTVLVASQALPAVAAFRPRSLGDALPPPAARIVEAKPQVTPIAYLRFCLQYATQCSMGVQDRIELTASAWSDLRQTNAAINTRIQPDRNKGGFEWSLDTTFGNCNDYAVQKRKALLDLGYPAGALSLSVVETGWGEGHLVLTVRTDRGDYVLDNLRPNILAWNRTGYQFREVQSLADPAVWVAPVSRPARPNHAPRFFRAAPVEALKADSVTLATPDDPGAPGARD